MNTFSLSTIKLFLLQNIKYYLFFIIVTIAASAYYYNSIPQKYNANIVFEMFASDINTINQNINNTLNKKKINLEIEKINPISDTYRFLYIPSTYENITKYDNISAVIPIPQFDTLEYGDMNHQSIKLVMTNFETKSDALLSTNTLIKNLNFLVRKKTYSNIESKLNTEIIRLSNEKTKSEKNLKDIEKKFKLIHMQMISVLTEAEKISKIYSKESIGNMNQGELIYTPSMTFYDNEEANLFKKMFFQEGHGSIEEKLAQTKEINLQNILSNDKNYQKLKDDLINYSKNIYNNSNVIKELDLILDQNYNYNESVNIKTNVTLIEKILLIELISFSILLSIIMGSLLGILKSGIKFID